MPISITLSRPARDPARELDSVMEIGIYEVNELQ